MNCRMRTGELVIDALIGRVVLVGQTLIPITERELNQVIGLGVEDQVWEEVRFPVSDGVSGIRMMVEGCVYSDLLDFLT